MVPTDKPITVAFLGRERPLKYNYAVYCRIQQKIDELAARGVRPRNMLDPGSLRLMDIEELPGQGAAKEKAYKVTPLLQPLELAIYLWGGIIGGELSVADLLAGKETVTVDEVAAALDTQSANTFLRTITEAIYESMPKPTPAEEAAAPTGPPQPPAA